MLQKSQLSGSWPRKIFPDLEEAIEWQRRPMIQVEDRYRVTLGLWIPPECILLDRRTTYYYCRIDRRREIFEEISADKVDLHVLRKDTSSEEDDSEDNHMVFWAS